MTKQLLLCRDHEKISRDNEKTKKKMIENEKEKNNNAWPLRTSVELYFINE